jgi:hypothetical protein
MRKNQQKKRLASMEKKYEEMKKNDPTNIELGKLRDKIETFKKRIGRA